MALTLKIFEKHELISIAIVTLALGFGFAYKFEGPATLGSWFGNFILVLALVAISVVVHEIVHKEVGKRFFAEVTSKVWPSGIVALFVITILSGGLITFAAPWAVSITPKRTYRMGRTFPHLGPREQAMIALSGPMASLGLAVLAKILAPALGLVADKLILINATLAIFNLFPFFMILPIIAAQKSSLKPLETPYTEGEFVFFGNRLLWVFVFFFTLIAGVSLLFLGALASLLIAFIAALVIWIAWHYFWEAEVIFGKGEGPSFKGYR